MLRGSGRFFGLSFAFFTLGAFLTPVSTTAQIVDIGGHFVANMDAREDVTWGVGPRLQLSDPMLGFSLLLTYDFYSPDCGTLQCDLDEFGLDLLWSLPMPFLLDPYLGAGLAFQKWEGRAYEGKEKDTAVTFLAGIALQGSTFERFRPFIEGKYQVSSDFPNQKVIAGGILLRIL